LCTSHGGDLYGLNDPISKAIKRYVIRNVDTMTVVSSAMQDEIKKLVPEANLPTVAPMGTDLNHLFTPDDSVGRKLNQLLFVGRLVEKKGLKYLLQVMPEMLKRHPDTHLNIAGTGPEQSNLKVQAEQLHLTKHITFLGRLSHQELVKEYREATLAVFPFVQAKDGDIEGLGLVMIEAMGCGCPVLASDIPAVRDVIVNGETGVLVKTAKSQDIMVKVSTLLRSQKTRRRIENLGREKVMQDFSWEASKNNYISVLENMTKNRSGKNA